MKWICRILSVTLGVTLLTTAVKAQHPEKVKLVKTENEHRIDVIIGNKLFTSFLYPDTLEKPVLYPVFTAGGTMVTRSFPVHARLGDPTDHPHHLGLWLNYEKVNGLDFWNNSYAIPAADKKNYGWIKTDRIEKMTDGEPGILVYHANWCNQQGAVLLEETTRFEFSGAGKQRIIDRLSTLTADTDVTFDDAKDGLLGFRLAHELQIPAKEDQSFSDDKGNVTIVKGGTDRIANGNYMTSEGKEGDAAWSTRAVWCKVYGKMGDDSVSIAIIDHPGNPDYPTFWHARGYGLFAANPLGKKVFTKGKESLNLMLKKGASVHFRYRIVVDENNNSIPAAELDRLAAAFAKKDQ